MLTRRPRPPAARAAFTLVELLVVITIIVILVGLTVGVAGYANQKAARSRAESEMKALSAALENYKADNGIYPRDTNTTDKLDARIRINPSDYLASNRVLYALLTGQIDGAGAPKAEPVHPPTPTAGSKIYFEFKPNMLSAMDPNEAKKKSEGNVFKVGGINDPYGYSYGYSTIYAAELDRKQTTTPPETTPVDKGYNPTFDLWSTGGKTDGVQAKWVTNW